MHDRLQGIAWAQGNSMKITGEHGQFMPARQGVASVCPAGARRSVSSECNRLPQLRSCVLGRFRGAAKEPSHLIQRTCAQHSTATAAAASA